MTDPSVARALDAALARLLEADLPLAQRLDAYAATLRALNQPFAEAVDRLVARLESVEAGSTAPRVGDALPPILLPDQDGHLVSTEALLADGPLVVAFRRGHWCPYCLLSTQALARIEDSIVRQGCRMAVITPEREVYGRELRARTGARFPVLSDIDNGVALSLGLAISVGEDMREFMAARGRDLGAYHGNDSWILPIPAMFVLGRDGRITFRHVDADYRRRVNIDELLAAVAAAA